MGTRILSDIHNDIKRLITAITLFEENEEGFKVCERFCQSNIKHHRYLSVNGNSTKAAVKAVATKFSIHGKYEVAKKFEELVETFLSSFDFEHHPQYDLQWYLLTFLLELSKETSKSDLECLKSTRGECTINATIGVKADTTEEIDWAEYLQEGNEDFFFDYGSETESEWSEDSNEEVVDAPVHYDADKCNAEKDKIVCLPAAATHLNKLSRALEEELESRNWLLANVQNTWWNELNWKKHQVISKFCDAHLCEIWHKAKEGDAYALGTLSEYQVSREILWMFQVQTQMVVFQKDADENFSIHPNISIPSLTTVAFNSILLPFCEIFSMIHQMEKFGRDLYHTQSGHKKPPLVYEAYYAGLKHHFIKIRQEIRIIEQQIMLQDGCNTLLSLLPMLKKNKNTIKTLHEIHESAISDWKVCPNWVCATKLLSNIYSEMQKSHSHDRVNICADLYLSALTVYLNIIDTWLSQGRLEDWRNEFMIVRISTDQMNKSLRQYEGFTVRSLDDIYEKDPILNFLTKKVQYLGQSIELLVSLDRISDIWKVNEDGNRTQKPLVSEFFEKLELEILKYSMPETNVEVDEIHDVDGIVGSLFDADVEENVIEQLSENNNPFLIKALEDYIPLNLLKRDTTDAPADFSSEQSLTYSIFEKLKNVQYILPFRKILETNLSEILISRYDNASRLVKGIMMKEYRLEEHLALMRSVYMMEAGHIMSKFYQILFHEIETNQMWSNSYFLSCIFEEVLSHQWPDFSSRWSVTVQESMTNQVLLAVDNITVHYAAGWPMNIMLNEKTFERYNEIFRFQLKLKWALWTLNNLRFIDLEGSKSECRKSELEQFQIKRLESLRYWLLHAIGSIHAYLSGQVLQNLGLVLEKGLKQAESLDVIVTIHNEYLRKVHEHCLLTKEFEDLMATINNLIDMCSQVRKWWTDKKIVLAITELDTLQSNYTKYHTYLALALHNAVQNKDANYYEIILQPTCETVETLSNENSTWALHLNDISRCILAEAAHQYLPPSGLPISIPRTVFIRDWYEMSSDFEPLSTEIIIHGYEQTFSYLRWYHHEKNFIQYNVSSRFLRQEIKNVIDSQSLQMNES